MASFHSLGVPADLVDALDARGITEAFPIQEATIPDALAGRDVSGRAPTGSGKTLAFGIPVVARVRHAGPKKPKALVLLPTRELAAQVARDLAQLGIERDTRVHAFYGGVGFEPQVKALRRGVDIAVACPGRLADLVAQRQIRLDGVEIVVVDEADRMADMGFLPEVKRLLDQTSPNRQTLLFSATLDGDVDVLVKRYQNDPVRHDVMPPERAGRVDHHFWTVERSDRVGLTASLVARHGSTIVFTRTRHGADRLAKQLSGFGVSAAAIHGNRTQRQRDNALDAFTRGKAQALVATDVAARGIHVDDVACVVHYDLPPDPKDYVHRSGRTGRAEAAGQVFALALPDQSKLAKQLIRELSIDSDLGPVDPSVSGPAVARAPQRRTDEPKESAKTMAGPRRTSRHGRSDRAANGQDSQGPGSSRGKPNRKPAGAQSATDGKTRSSGEAAVPNRGGTKRAGGSSRGGGPNRAGGSGRAGGSNSAAGNTRSSRGATPQGRGSRSGARTSGSTRGRTR